MWSLIASEKEADIGDGVYTFGGTGVSDIPHTSVGETHISAQIKILGDFLFLMEKSKIRCFYHVAEFNVEGKDYLARSQSQNHSFDDRFPNRDDLKSAFTCAAYKETLREIQVNHSAICQDKNLYKELIQRACEFMDKVYWADKDFVNEDEAQLYIWILWLIQAEVYHYGILTPLLQDDTITEIMANSPQQIFVERRGKIQLSDVFFHDETQMRVCIERIVSATGRRIDESSPYCDARLKDGSRIHAIIPPLALNGPCLTVRKFFKNPLDPEKLVELGAWSPEIRDFLREKIAQRRNFIISGGTGTGKTTLLNALSSFIPSDERIITIEDSAELKLQQEHVIRLESRPSNVEGKGEVGLRDLVRNALRMRPDRVIVGECRGSEALDMLQAMNTGHDGSMTTVHANTPPDALRRIETLCLFGSAQIPSHAIREQMKSAIHFIVQLSRLKTGERKVVAIHEIDTSDTASERLKTKPVVEFKADGGWVWF